MRRSFVKSNLLFVLITLIMPIAYATPSAVLPVYNNFWYTDADVSGQNESTCQPNQLTYTYTNKFNTLSQIEQYIVASLPKHTDCVWQPFNFVRGDRVPLDFPGNNEDYANVSQTEPPTMTWSAFCNDDQTRVIDYKDGNLYPSYTCPKGSIYFYPDDKTEGRCYAYKDISCLGDVVGRDLDAPIISTAGHVGVTVSIDTIDQAKENLSSVIAEVLNKTPSIQFNSLTSFKNAVPNYWGAKYDLPSYQPITVNQVIAMYLLGIEQARFEPTYTFSWFWYPGGPATKYIFDLDTMSWVKKLVIEHGRFRCDAFVYYLYQEGAGMRIPYSSLMTPKTLYDAFLSTRNEDPALLLHSHNYNFIDNKVFPSIVNQNDLESQIKQVFSQSNLDINQADQLTYQYINDISISRSEKINFLWGLAQQYSSNAQKFTYLISVLTQTKPTEIANDLIYFYKNIQDPDEKSSLLAVMDYSIYYNSLQEAQSLTQEQLNGVIAIEKFLKQQFQEENNNDLKQWLFMTNMNFLDSAEMSILLQQNINSNILNDDIKALAKVQILLSKPIVDGIITATVSDKNNSSILPTVCAVIYLLPDGYLHTNQLKIFRSYLESNKAQLITKKAKMKGCDYELTIKRLATIK